MATDLDICNMALLRLGTRSSMASLSEGSVEANACARLYPLVRDTLLAEHPWSFATKRAELALLGTAPTRMAEWIYRYAYPSDCLSGRSIYQPLRHGPPIPFQVSGDTDGQGNPILAILCNQPRAMLIYTAQITNSGLFPPRFVEAASWKLAAELVAALTGDSALSQAALNMAAAALNLAKVHDGNEGLTVQERTAEWVRVRGYEFPWFDREHRLP